MTENEVKKLKVLFELQKYDEVIKLCYENFSQENVDREIYTFLLPALLNSLRYKDALDEVDKAIGRFPNDSYFFYIKARAYFALAKNNQALTYIQKALKQEQSNDIYLHLLTKIYIAKKQYKQAKEIIDKVLRLSPNDTEFLVTYGVVLYGLDNHKESKKVFEQILAVEPHNQLALDFKSDFFGSKKERKNILKHLLFINPFDKTYQNDLKFIDFYYRYIPLLMIIVNILIYFSKGNEIFELVSNILFVIVALIGSFDVRINFVFILSVMVQKIGVNLESIFDIIVFFINGSIVTFIYYIGHHIVKTFYYKIKYDWIPRWKN